MWRDKGDASWLDGERNASSQFSKIFFSPTLLISWCLISHILLPFLQQWCFAWPEASSVSLSTGVVSCGAASGGAGERDAHRAQERGERKKARSAGGYVWRAAGGDTSLHSLAVIPQSHTSLLTPSCSHTFKENAKKKNLEMTWRHLDTMEGCGQDKKEHNTFTWFTYQRQHIDPHQYDVNVVKFHLQSLSRLKLYFTNEHDIQKQTKRHQSS